MKYRKLRIAWSVAWGVVAVVAFFSTTAFAYLPGYRTRAISSENGKYLLVLLAPPGGHYSGEPETEEEARAREETQRLEATYSQSGLYKNDGSADLLWPIEYQSEFKTIYVSDDGVHLVVAFLDWECGNCSGRGSAVEFYARGRLLSSYHEDAMLAGYFGRLLVSRYAGAAWPTCMSAKLDDANGAFEIATNWGDRFRFDVTTGKVVESTMSPAVKTVFLTAVILIGGLAWWMMRRWTRRARVGFGEPRYDV